LTRVKLYGCMFKLRSVDAGLSILIAGSICCDCQTVVQLISNELCFGNERHPWHQPCAGNEVQSIEQYTKQMVVQGNKAFHQYCCPPALRFRLPACPAARTDSGGAGRPVAGHPSGWKLPVVMEPQSRRPLLSETERAELESMLRNDGIIDGPREWKGWASRAARILLDIYAPDKEPSPYAMDRWARGDRSCCSSTPLSSGSSPEATCIPR